MKSTVVEKPKSSYKWCFWSLKCNKTCTHDVSRSRNATIKVRLTYFKVWKQEKRYAWCFGRAKDSMKSKRHHFSCHKQRNKMCLFYLELKLHQNRCAWCIYKWKQQRMVELRYWQTNKQLARYRWSLQMLKCLKKCNNAAFRDCKPTTKVQRMYLAFKNLKINGK